MMIGAYLVTLANPEFGSIFIHLKDGYTDRIMYKEFVRSCRKIFSDNVERIISGVLHLVL
jgi:hypothetical protein